MKIRAAAAAVGITIAMQLPSAGCTDAQLQGVVATTAAPDNKLTVSGEFCTEIPNPAQFPTRILFIVDTSLIQDPPLTNCGGPACLTRRGVAIEQTVQKYPPGDGVTYGLIFFASNATVVTTGANGLSGFTSDPNQILTALPQLANVTDGQSDFNAALTLAYQMLQSDMNNLDATSRSRARYEIVFMSDGAPDPDNTGPGESLPNDVRTDVLDIAGLQSSQQLATIALNTVYLSDPGTPPSAVFTQSTVMLDMATLGNGIYMSVDSTQAVNLFNIDFTSLVRTFTLKSFVTSNITERPGPGPTGGTVPKVDSDGDGLDDETEALIGTSPLLIDTDGDGFSDLLEYKLRNSGFNPLYPDDADCAQQTDREDKDGDGLLNCEERYIGTSLQLADTDADGYSDDLEYRMGTNPVIADNLGDLDFDSAPNGFELMNHTDPLRNDAADFSKIAYRYNLVAPDASAAAQSGRTCYEFSVDNISLAPALPNVPGTDQTGTNTVLLHVTTTPSDNPNDPGSHQIACIRPVYQEGVSSTSMVVPLGAFKTPGLGPDGGVGFDEHRDCIVP